MASLPPISAEIFNDKVLTAQASSNAVAAKASFEKACTACQKLYYSQNSYDNHLKGHRHRTAAASLAADGSVTDTGSVVSSTISLGDPINGITGPGVVTPKQIPLPIEPEAEAEFSNVVNVLKEAKTDHTTTTGQRRPTQPHHSSGGVHVEHPLPPDKDVDVRGASGRDQDKDETEFILNQCLFCLNEFTNLEENLKHMGMTHGMFIPEKPYLIDAGGLIHWLWQQMNEEPHQCLYCHKLRSSAEAIRGHMRDSGHCKIAFEEDEDMIQVGQFYDFSSTYSDDDGDTDINEDVEMPNVQEREDDWEDDSDVDSDDLDDEVHIDRTKQAIISKSRGGLDPSTQGFVFDEELYLPSGRIAGHRSLKKYFRQNLHNRATPDERIERQKHLEIGESTGSDVASGADRNRGRQLVSRADGGIGMVGVTDDKKREVKLVEKRDTKRAQRAEKLYEWGVQKRANNQKHFRDPLLQ